MPSSFRKHPIIQPKTLYRWSNWQKISELIVCFCVVCSFEKEDFLESSRILSTFAQLKTVLYNILCVFEYWQLMHVKLASEWWFEPSRPQRIISVKVVGCEDTEFVACVSSNVAFWSRVCFCCVLLSWAINEFHLYRLLPAAVCMSHFSVSVWTTFMSRL